MNHVNKIADYIAKLETKQKKFRHHLHRIHVRFEIEVEEALRKMK
jgi:alpha-D-ribose 1-methylphosphonate 5-triphosphate diphosphatase PhnM